MNKAAYLKLLGEDKAYLKVAHDVHQHMFPNSQHGKLEYQHILDIMDSSVGLLYPPGTATATAKISKVKDRKPPLPTYDTPWIDMLQGGSEPPPMVIDAMSNGQGELVAILLLRLLDSWGRLDPPLEIEEFRPRAGFEVYIVELSMNAIRIAIKHKDEYRDYVFRIDGDGAEFP